MAKIIYIDKIKSYKEKFMAEMEMDINKSYAAAVERSKKLEEDLVKNRINTSTVFSKNFFTVANPIPRVPPVTTATFPSNILFLP